MTQEKALISYQVTLGDSLTDGGQFQHSKPLLADITDLKKSPYGRFTDGYTWADDIARSAALDVLKEQFIHYIINAVDPDKLDNPEIEIEHFKSYIRAIDLENFHPSTFNFEKFKNSYLKRHLFEEKLFAYLKNLFVTNEIDSEASNAFLDYLKSLPLESFHPDRFDLQALLEDYKKLDDANQKFIISLNELINVGTVTQIATNVRQKYQSAPNHHNNIFDAIDYKKFNVKHLNENISNFLYGSFSLGDYQRVLFQGHNFVRRFAEGGLSAHAYHALPDRQMFSLILEQIKYTIGEFKLSFKYLASFVGQFFKLLGTIIGARAMLSNLNEKTNSLLKDDEEQKISLEQKNKTLVTEWTGANDFITMNAFASEKVCDDAIKARIDNIIKLAQNGYKNFLLIDLPDLGKTPRYLNSPEEERVRVSELVSYFNQQLRQKIKELSLTNPQLDIKVFPLSERFDAIYANPESFGLSKDIDKQHPLLSVNPNELNEDGYMFWDDVHPSNLMHHILAQEAYKFVQNNYSLQPPVEVANPCCPVAVAKGLLATFKDKYLREYEDEATKIMGLSRFFSPKKKDLSKINWDPKNIHEARQSLSQIYQWSKEDKIVNQSLVHLGWLQKDGQIPKENIAPLLTQSYELAQKAADKDLQTTSTVTSSTENEMLSYC